MNPTAAWTLGEVREANLSLPWHPHRDQRRARSLQRQPGCLHAAAQKHTGTREAVSRAARTLKQMSKRLRSHRCDQTSRRQHRPSNLLLVGQAHKTRHRQRWKMVLCPTRRSGVLAAMLQRRWKQANSDACSGSARAAATPLRPLLILQTPVREARWICHWKTAAMTTGRSQQVRASTPGRAGSRCSDCGRPAARHSHANRQSAQSISRQQSTRRTFWKMPCPASRCACPESLLLLCQQLSRTSIDTTASREFAVSFQCSGFKILCRPTATPERCLRRSEADVLSCCGGRQSFLRGCRAGQQSTAATAVMDGRRSLLVTVTAAPSHSCRERRQGSGWQSVWRPCCTAIR